MNEFGEDVETDLGVGYGCYDADGDEEEGGEEEGEEEVGEGELERGCGEEEGGEEETGAMEYEVPGGGDFGVGFH